MKNSIFTNSGFRKVNFSLTPEAIKQLKNGWQTYTESIKQYPSHKYAGKGIVMSAGGISYFTCAWVSISRLRKLGCTLPIELWHLGGELSEEAIENLETLNVICRNYLDLGKSNLKGVMLKPLAIIASSFEEVLFLDADNNCIINPQYLFETKPYLKYGAVFWPDYWTTEDNNPIWQIIDKQPVEQHEQESGQLLINKKKSWTELHLSLYFNTNHEIYYRMLYGDKDTFRFAWNALNTSFYMSHKNVDSCGHKDTDGNFVGTTMVQYGLNNEKLFLHRNLLKWDITMPNEKNWKTIRGFKNGAVHKEYELKFHYNGHNYLELKGDIEDSSDIVVEDFEADCLDILQRLRKERFYSRFLIYSNIYEKRFMTTAEISLR